MIALEECSDLFGLRVFFLISESENGHSNIEEQRILAGILEIDQRNQFSISKDCVVGERIGVHESSGQFDLKKRLDLSSLLLKLGE